MGCDECGFYWNYPDEDKPCPACEATRLRAEVERLRELLDVVRLFLVVRPTQIQAYGLEACKLIDRMAELITESGGAGDELQ